MIGRHKMGVGAASIVAIVLVAAVAATSWGLVQAKLAQRSAERRREAAEFLRDRAERKLLVTDALVGWYPDSDLQERREELEELAEGMLSLLQTK
ncbi:MAG: hypothetical protein V3V35_00440, partial [Dehalococcoidia bacterium]